MKSEREVIEEIIDSMKEYLNCDAWLFYNDQDLQALQHLLKENEDLEQALDDEVNKHRRNNVEQLEEIRQLTQENEKLKEEIKKVVENIDGFIDGIAYSAEQGSSQATKDLEIMKEVELEIKTLKAVAKE